MQRRFFPSPIGAASIQVRRNRGVRIPAAEVLTAVSASQEGAEVGGLRFSGIVCYLRGGSQEGGWFGLRGYAAGDEFGWRRLRELLVGLVGLLGAGWRGVADGHMRAVMLGVTMAAAAPPPRIERQYANQLTP